MNIGLLGKYGENKAQAINVNRGGGDLESCRLREELTQETKQKGEKEIIQQGRCFCP